MKYLVLIFVLALVGCDEDICLKEPNQKLRAELFDKCLVRAAEARKGKNYTTNDDEDYDEVISECGRQAYYLSLNKDHCKQTQPRNTHDKE